MIDPRTPTLMALAHFIAYAAIIPFTIGASFKIDSFAKCSWFIIFVPIWIADAIAACLFIWAIFAPFPYIKQLSRLGAAKLGAYPSGTELIRLFLMIAGRLLLLILFTAFQITICSYLENPGAISLGIAGIPLYLLLVLALFRAIVIVDHSLEILLATICSGSLYVILVLKRDYQIFIPEFTTLLPLHAFFFVGILMVLMSYERCENKKLIWLSKFAGFVLLEFFTISLELELSGFLNRNPRIVLLPLILGMILWLPSVADYSRGFVPSSVNLPDDNYSMDSEDSSFDAYSEDPLLSSTRNARTNLSIQSVAH